MVTKKSAKAEQPTSMSAVVSPIQSAPTNYVIDFFNEDVRLLVEAFLTAFELELLRFFKEWKSWGVTFPTNLRRRWGMAFLSCGPEQKKG